MQNSSRPAVSKRHGFTLVELLVVIAIIGVLVSLLLPAVQAAREAARRTECSNNLHQFGLAIHQFHDTFNRFPPGGAVDQAPYFGKHPTGAAWGSSWLVYILPYIEQQGLFDKWQMTGGSGWGSTANGALISNVKFKGFHCPSSPLEQECTSMPPGASGFVQSSSYVGIAGATDSMFTAVTSQNRAYSETRQISGSSGIVGASGVLVPNARLTFASIKDGTTNVMIVSEYSNFLYNQASPPAKFDWRSSDMHGFAIGVGNATVPKDPNNAGGWTGDNRTFSLTTIRWEVNYGTRAPGFTGNCAGEGVCDNASVNIPINSSHPGGVLVTLGDASVRFVSQTTSLDTLGRLAVRDDGQPMVGLE